MWRESIHAACASVGPAQGLPRICIHRTFVTREIWHSYKGIEIPQE